MSYNTENFIKGRIGEVLVEELLRELGFFVLPLGKEHVAAPITNMKQFIQKCKGTFAFEKSNDEILPKEIIDSLPDFIAVHPNGKTELIEVKYRRDAKLYEKDERLFDIYPEVTMIVVNPQDSQVKKDLIDSQEPTYKEDFEALKGCRFHVWNRDDLEKSGTPDKKEELQLGVKGLVDWLKEEYEFDATAASRLINEYEQLVKRWYAPDLKKPDTS